MKQPTTVCMMKLEQLRLDLGAAAHIDLLHHQNNFGVNLVEIDSFSGWRPIGTMPKNQAISISLSYEDSDVPLFVSQQPIRPNQRRCVDNVVFYSSFYVDLDIYNTEYADTPFNELLGLIMSSVGGLPIPTIAGSSGRGVYLVWVLHRGLSKKQLAQWQVIENNLIDALRKFGADPKASDAARVLRVSNTYNPKSGTRVALQQLADPVSFRAMRDWNRAYEEVKPKPKPIKPKQSYDGKKPKLRKVIPVGQIKNPYTLAYARMGDLAALAQARGGKYTDHRRRVIYLFTAIAAWFFKDSQSLLNEVDYFIDRYIHEPERYKSLSLSEILNRFEESKENTKRLWKGEEVDPRYRFRNKTLINELEINLDEQRSLSTIISTSEKNRRKNEKRASERRSKGVPERSEYLRSISSCAAERRSEAVRLRVSGMPVSLIAKELRVSAKTVYGYFNMLDKESVTP